MLDTVSFYLDSFPGYSRGTFLDQLCFGGFGSGCHCLEAAAVSVCDSSAVALFLDPEGLGTPKHLQGTPELGKSRRA